MPIRYVPLAALAVFAAVPAFAQGSTAPAGAAQPPTRSTIQKTIDENFKAIDANGDGSLSQAELATAENKVLQQRVAQARGRVEAEFAKLDTNKDGSLSKTEFMGVMSTPTTSPNGSKSLAELDRNKDGKVTADEYRAPMLAQFDRVDSNKDGTLSQAEMKAAQPAQKR